MATIGSLTVAQVLALRAASRVAAVHPRKRLVVVDGYKHFRLAGVWPAQLPLV